MWCVSKLDAVFIKRMEDLLKLYERPLNPNEPVVCLDERPVKLHGEKRRGHHVRPGRPARYDYEYVRQGTANIFCAVEPRAGRHIRSRRSGAAPTLRRCLCRFRGGTRRRRRSTMDNLSTHFLSSCGTMDNGEVVRCGIGSRSTTRPNTGAGSPRSKSACSIGSVWADGEFRRSMFCDPKFASGTHQSSQAEDRLALHAEEGASPVRLQATSTFVIGSTRDPFVA
jgi:hypothetical protein